MADTKDQVAQTKPLESGVGGVRKLIVEAAAKAAEKMVGKSAARVGESTYTKVGDSMPQPRINTSGGSKTVRTTGETKVTSNSGATSTTPNTTSTTFNKPPLSQKQVDSIKNMHNAKIEKTAQTAGYEAASSARPELVKTLVKGAVGGGAIVATVDKLLDSKPKGTQDGHAVTAVDRKTGKSK